MADETQVADPDEVENEDENRNEPSIVADSAQPITPVPETPSPAIAPVASGPLPAAGFRRTSAVPEAEQPVAIAGPASVAAIPFPGDQAPTPINPRVPPVAPTGATVAGNAVRQNPFAAMMSNEPAIHSPVARVLHKFAMMSPEIRQEEERKAEFAADQPYKQAQTEDIEQQVAQRKAETARMVGGQVPIDKPIPIYAAPGTPNAGEQVGEKGYDKYGQWHENMFPTGGAAAPAAGPAAGPAPGPVAGPSPTVATIPAGANSVPVSAQTPPAAAAGPTSGPPARTTTTMKPQEPQRAPLPTPKEAAELAPATPDSIADYQQKVKALGLPAGNVFDKVPPGTTNAQLEKRYEDAKGLKTMTQTEADRKLRDQERLDAKSRSEKETADKETHSEIDKAQAKMLPDLVKSDAKIENLQEAMGLLDKPNGEKDALAPVKVLVASAGGAGTGVRVTMPELQNIAQARGWTDTAEVTLNNMFDPDSYEKMSKTQRSQLKGIIGDVYKSISGKNDAAHAAYERITNSRNVDEVRAAQSDYDKLIRSQNTKTPGGATGHVIEMNGARYQYNGTGDTADIKNYTKQ